MQTFQLLPYLLSFKLNHLIDEDSRYTVIVFQLLGHTCKSLLHHWFFVTDMQNVCVTVCLIGLWTGDITFHFLVPLWPNVEKVLVGSRVDGTCNRVVINMFVLSSCGRIKIYICLLFVLQSLRLYKYSTVLFKEKDTLKTSFLKKLCNL